MPTLPPASMSTKASGPFSIPSNSFTHGFSEPSTIIDRSFDRAAADSSSDQSITLRADLPSAEHKRGGDARGVGAHRKPCIVTRLFTNSPGTPATTSPNLSQGKDLGKNCGAPRGPGSGVAVSYCETLPQQTIRPFVAMLNSAVCRIIPPVLSKSASTTRSSDRSSQKTVRRESDDIEAESLKLSWGVQMSMPSGQAAESSLRKFSDLPANQNTNPSADDRIQTSTSSRKLESEAGGHVQKKVAKRSSG